MDCTIGGVIVNLEGVHSTLREESQYTCRALLCKFCILVIIAEKRPGHTDGLKSWTQGKASFHHRKERCIDTRAEKSPPQRLAVSVD